MKSIKEINIKNFDPNLLNIDKSSFKSTNLDIYHIEHIIMKNFDNQNPLYLIFNDVNWYIKGSNGNKYFIFASTDKKKEVFKKYTELWNEIKLKQ